MAENIQHKFRVKSNVYIIHIINELQQNLKNTISAIQFLFDNH